MTRMHDKPALDEELDPSIDPRVVQYPVNWAIYLASAIYARDYTPEGCARRTSANLVIHEFQRGLALFDEGSRERIYLSRILNIAVDLAIGIRTKKEIRSSRLEDAQQDRDMHYQKLVRAERWQGVLRLAAKLLLLSGFGYAIARTVLTARPDDGMSKSNENWASAAFGMGFALIATYIRSWIVDRRIGQLFRKHDQAARAAHDEYQRTVGREYRWAADEAIDAWERLTGRRPRLNTAAILSLLAPEDELEPADE